MKIVHAVMTRIVLDDNYAGFKDINFSLSQKGARFSAKKNKRIYSVTVTIKQVVDSIAEMIAKRESEVRP
jgi:hypothetical protein